MKNRIISGIAWIETILERSDFLGRLLIRIILAEVFVIAGWGKLQHLPRVIAFFGHLGLPAPGFLAHLVAFSEFVCGGLILLGLLTRLASIPLIIIMIVALMTAKADQISSFADLVTLSEFLYIALLMRLLQQGAGFLSLDHFLKKHSRKNFSARLVTRSPEATNFPSTER